MNLRVVPALVCAALALAAGPAALAADDAQRPPKELWDEFPLEPSATPAQAAPQATRSPVATRVQEESDGMAPGALIALLAAAAVVGGVAGRTATRLIRRHAGTVDAADVHNGQPREPAPHPQDDAGANGRERPTGRSPDRMARPHAAREQGTEAIAPGPNDGAARPHAAQAHSTEPTAPTPNDRAARPHAAQAHSTEASQPSPHDRAARPHAAQAHSTEASEPSPNDTAARPHAAQAHSTEASEPSLNENSAGPPADDRQAAAAGEAAAEPAPQETTARRRAANGQRAKESGGAGEPTRTSATRPRRDAKGRFVKADRPTPNGTPPRQAEPSASADEPVPNGTPPRQAEPSASADEPVPTGTPPRQAEPIASGDEPTQNGTPAAPGVSPDAQAGVPTRISGKPAAAPEPAAPPPARPAWPAAEPTELETCKIKLHNRSIKAHFYAVEFEGGPVLARSPYFKIRRAEGDAALGAPEALHALVDELAAAGWRQTGAGRAPWDLRFERGARARQPALPRRRS